ncbi:MAG: hypothetical protein WDO15_17785 [Bacteroidota bacterium]
MKTLIGLGFITLTILFFWLFVRLFRSHKNFKSIAIAFVAWAVFLTVWSLSGMASRFDTFPLNMAPVLLIPFIAIILFTFSKSTQKLLSSIPAKSIVQLQVFRVFVELLLWALAVQNLLPIQMTFEGRNFDILSGLTAPFAAMFLSRSKWGLAIWNIACLGLLINIVAVAILSMPTPLRIFNNEPANTIVAEFPFILLPGMLVPLAYGLSLLSLRQVFSLNLKNEKTSSTPFTAGILRQQ